MSFVLVRRVIDDIIDGIALQEVRKGPWIAEEDQKILDMISRVGYNWSKISHALPGRLVTDMILTPYIHH